MKKSSFTPKKAIALGLLLIAASVATSASANEGRVDPSVQRGLPHKAEMRPVQKSIDLQNITLALTQGDYALFTKALLDANIKEPVSEAQFSVMVSAFAKVKAGDIAGAQKGIVDAKLSPLLHRLIMGQKASLTEAQKTALKNAGELLKQGKKEEARIVLEAAGLTNLVEPIKSDRSTEIKSILEKAKVLRAEGKTEEAKAILKDAGITEKAEAKIQHEVKIDKKENAKNNIFKRLKHFFRFGKQ